MHCNSFDTPCKLGVFNHVLLVEASHGSVIVLIKLLCVLTNQNICMNEPLLCVVSQEVNLITSKYKTDRVSVLVA